MIGALSASSDPRHTARDAFAAALAGFAPDRPVLVLGHFDADGLSAVAILVRALRAAGRTAEHRITGKGETPWDEPLASELRAAGAGGLIVTDLGTRAEPVAPGVPTIVIDHHLPTGLAPDTTVISGNGLSPEPTSALLAWWCAGALGEQADLLWLAALGLIGDMADAFPEQGEAEARWGKTALKDAVSLVNAPRRAAPRPPTPARRSACCSTATGPRRSPKATATTPARSSPPRRRCATRWRPRAGSRPRSRGTSR